MPKIIPLAERPWTPEEVEAGEQLLPGLFRNGRLYWTRIKHPATGVVDKFSTTFADIPNANKARRLVDELLETRAEWHWLDQLFLPKPEFTLGQLVAAGNQRYKLEAQRADAVARSKDADLDPIVDKWLESVSRREHDGRRISTSQLANYTAEIRRLIPKGVKFPASKFTEQHVRDTLDALNHKTRKDEKGKPVPLSPTAKKQHFNTWRQFYEYARKPAKLTTENPFTDIPAAERPKRNKARTTFWLYFPYHNLPNVQQFIEALPSLYAKAIAALVFGCGVEVGVLYTITKSHLHGRDEETGDYVVHVEGTKVTGVRSRFSVLQEWAIPHVEAYVASLGEHADDAPLFNVEQLGFEKATKFRQDVWYPAQRTLGWIKQDPPKSEVTGKLLWGDAKDAHGIHDGRHTYAIIRRYGLDGEPSAEPEDIAERLGHADTQMVTRVYTKMDQDRRQLVQRLSKLLKSKKASAQAAAKGIHIVKEA